MFINPSKQANTPINEEFSEHQGVVESTTYLYIPLQLITSPQLGVQLLASKSLKDFLYLFLPWSIQGISDNKNVVDRRQKEASSIKAIKEEIKSLFTCFRNA